MPIWPTSFPGLSAPHYDIALPLGISFFTFHHIMYLTDLKAGKAPRYDLVRYAMIRKPMPLVRQLGLGQQRADQRDAKPEPGRR